MDRRYLTGYELGRSASPPEEYWADAISVDDSDKKIEAYIERQRPAYREAWMAYIDEDNW